MLDRKIDHYSMEKRYIRKDGKLIWINLTVSLVWTKENSPDYFISVVEDISLRKLAENEVKRLRNSLVEVQESERRFIALELHDEFGQRLGAANIVLSLAQKMNSVAAVDDLLMQAKSIIDGLIKTTKEMAQQLHPAQLDYFGLSAAVRALVAEVSQQVDIFIQLNELIGNLRFHSSTELTAYRVIQEALSNALRHSKTIEITVTLSVENDFLNVRISDSGIGLPKAQEHSQGLGLLGMQERVQSVGGVFSVRSQALSGTEVHAVLPLTVRGKN
jgi:signal transduction histidine kinase